MLDDAGIVIRNVFHQLNVPYYVTTAVPFFHPDHKVVKRHAEQTTAILREEIERVDPESIILMGADSTRWCPIFPETFSKFGDVQNRIFEGSGRKFLVSPAPVSVAKVPATYRDFIDNVSKLLNPDPADIASDTGEGRYSVLTNAAQIKRSLGRLGNRIAVDIESTSLDPYTGRILTIQVSDTPGTGYAYRWDALTPDEWNEYLGGKRYVFQNGSFDVKYLACNGVFLRVDEDTMLLHSLIDETPRTHGMEAMSRKYLGIEKWSEMVDYDNLEAADIQDLGVYGARDADITLQLADTFLPDLEGRKIVDVLHRAQNSMIRTELRGIRVDRDLALVMQEEIEGIKHDLQQHMEDHYGLLNPNSPKQVAALLYDDGTVPEPKNRSTASGVIEPFADDHPVIRDILEYRHLTKAGSTYLRNILDLSERDGRYHPEFFLAATETGRIAEKLILLIPRPDNVEGADRGKQYQYRLRELFVPDEGKIMVGADYSGLEVRMAAVLSGDRQLIDDLNSGIDTHSVNAIRAFDLDIPLEPLATLKKRTSENNSYERTLAKFATFTWLYGGGVGAISQQLNISLAESKKILDALQERYSDLAEWQRRMIVKGRLDNRIQSLWGRERHFAFNIGMGRRSEGDQQREMTNFPIQSLSSDMTLKAFTTLEEMGYETLFPFHDAVYAQCYPEDLDDTVETIREVMENVIVGPVAFEVDIKSGFSWAELG
jgi:DNA polymerase-1